MKQTFFMAMLLSLLAISTSAEARGRHQKKHGKQLYEKQMHQRQRIRQGMKSGQLTRMEARRLNMQQAKIANYKRMAKADGFISPKERHLIRREQMLADRSIYRQKHDGQRGYGHYRQFRN